MAFKINELDNSAPTDVSYEQAFRRFLEPYLPLLRDHNETTMISVDPHDVYKYEGDLYGLFQANKIGRKMHWIVMRTNDLLSNEIVPTDLQVILVPSTTIVNQLKQFYRQRKKTLR